MKKNLFFATDIIINVLIGDSIGCNYLSVFFVVVESSTLRPFKPYAFVHFVAYPVISYQKRFCIRVSLLCSGRNGHFLQNNTYLNDQSLLSLRVPTVEYHVAESVC